jgi:hypothetical protein
MLELWIFQERSLVCVCVYIYVCGKGSTIKDIYPQNNKIYPQGNPQGGEKSCKRSSV